MTPLILQASLTSRSGTIRYIENGKKEECLLKEGGSWKDPRKEEKNYLKNYKDTPLPKICLTVMVEWQKQLSCAVG